MKSDTINFSHPLIGDIYKNQYTIFVNRKVQINKLLRLCDYSCINGTVPSNTKRQSFSSFLFSGLAERPGAGPMEYLLG